MLADQDDEDETERGRLLVTSEAGWRTEMAKWIADARRDEEDDTDSDEEERVQPQVRAYAKITL